MPHTPPHNPPPNLTTTTPAASSETTPQPPQPSVPLAIWPTPDTAPARPPAGASGRVWMVPPLLAQHLVAVYTAPGGTVLAVGGSARTVARTAVRLDRRPPNRDHRAAPAGSVDLLVITPSAVDPAIGDTGSAGSGVWRRWPRLLTATGILAVVLPPTRAPGDPAAVIGAAVGAGLTYLQHAIAVLWTLHADHLDPPSHPDPVEPGGSELAAAHADVVLFTPGPSSDPDPAGPGAGPLAGPRSVSRVHEGETR